MFDGNSRFSNYLTIILGRNVERCPPILALVIPFPDGEEPDVSAHIIWFQQDNAPSHYARSVREHCE